MDTSCNRHRLTQSYKCCDRCSRFNVVVEMPRLMAVVTSKHVRRWFFEGVDLHRGRAGVSIVTASAKRRARSL
jgi:hypothetical protein